MALKLSIKRGLPSQILIRFSKVLAKSELTLSKLSLGVYFANQFGTNFSKDCMKIIVGNFLWFGKTFAIVGVKQFTAESFYAFFQSALAMCSATLLCKIINTLG